MNILFAVSEADPFIKTGGLADVAGSLPKALKALGNDVRVVLPLYGRIPHSFKEKMNKIAEFYVDLDWRHEYAGVLSLEHEGVTFYFIDNEHYFNRGQIYGEFDDAERFIFFSKAVTMLPKCIGFTPDIIHTNDWHTALVNVFVRDFARGDAYYHNIKTVYTIHNLKYQGVFPPEVLQLAGLSPFYYHEDAFKFYDAVNFMKAGIVFCDQLTTVSQSYAEEIRYSYFGEGLQGIINAHRNKLHGIVNGIDYDVWNPETDSHLIANYTVSDRENKAKNKREIQERFQLPTRDVPVISMVTRLVEMKGMDLVAFVMDELMQRDVQLIVLGTGDAEYENMLQYFQWKYPDKVAARIYYNNEEAHKIYAGSDYILMPSLAEPCGITQLIAMRYGTLPIVRETGGLRDTVQPYNKYTGEGTGFGFSNINAHEMLSVIDEAIGVYHDHEKYIHLQQQAMQANHDWTQSANEYMEMYRMMKQS